jgi:DNA-binding NarL/FixJ family response regulator
MVREALQLALARQGLVVAGEAGTVEETLAVVARAKPHVLVLDYSIPDGDAPAVLKAALARQPDLKVVVLTMHDGIDYAVRALEAGAMGFVSKSAPVRELVEAVRLAARGQTYISPAISQSVLKRLRQPKKDRSGLDALSEREFAVLRALGSGMGIKECAELLKIDSSTVSTYRTRIMTKLKLSGTPALIRFALENGLVG